MDTDPQSAQDKKKPLETVEIALAYKRYDREVNLRQISYYLCAEIGEPMAYTELFHTLRTANEHDVIFLHINSPGGNFDAGLQIVNNMKASPAHVITVLEARAYSMAAMIFLAGDELVVHDNCELMLHNYSGSLIGKGNEQYAQVVATGKWFQKVMHRVCHPFLSKHEIDIILKGEDIWMDSDEIARRLKQLNKNDALPKKKPGKAGLAE